MRLVQSDPAQEEVSIDVEARPGRGEVRADEEQPRGAGGPDQSDIVLADHPLREVADREADLGAGRGSNDGPLDALPTAVAVLAHPLLEVILDSR